MVDMDLDVQKIGIVVKDDPTNHLPRLYAMRLTMSEPRSKLEILGREDSKGNRPVIRRELHPNISLPRQARQYALKWRILRQNIEVIHDKDNKPKTKKSK